MAPILGLGVLLGAVCATAVSVVETAHHGRELANRLELLEDQADRYRMEWDKLLLEQGAWSGHGRISDIAGRRLDMEAPDPFEIVTIRQ